MIKKQRGVALITALLVVALAVIAATDMLSRQQLDIRRTATVLNSEQAVLYALGAEAWAAQVLRRDLRNNRHDHRNEVWALQLPPTLVEGGEIGGYLEDLQGRFNLNNLLDKEGQPSAPDREIFARLLDSLELPRSLAQAAIDWIDADIYPQIPDGAEDNEYLGRDIPYRAANRPFVSADEIRLLPGMDGDALQQLRPHITALPQRTAMNINTCTPLLLQAVFKEISAAQAETLLADPPDEGYKSLGEFLQQEALAGLQPPSGVLGVSSRYFVLRAQVEIDGSYALLSSVLYRGDNEIQVVLRSRSGGV